MKTIIALAGNPNSGKTTLFNLLTGANQYVGNWPGVTVEKKEGTLKKHKDIIIADLPGIYSLSPYSPEEIITRTYLMDSNPAALINIVDGSNLERNLFLTTQLMDMGIPMIIAINMMDVVRKSGDKLDTAALSKRIGCPVVEISALKNTGIDALIEAALKAAEEKKAPAPVRLSKETEDALSALSAILPTSIREDKKRWYEIKLLEKDEKATASLKLTQANHQSVQAIIKGTEEERDDESESIVTTDRYSAIASLLKGCFVKKDKNALSVSDKIDQIVTNRWLALPIFALVMYLVYYISVTTIGDIATVWTNDVLFGEIVPKQVESWLTALGTAPWLNGLILNGIVGGVGAVLGFVPQIFVLFFLLSLLEGCGYMARIAFIMDRIFRRFGLSGKSFIPMLIGTGCGIPGIMASRTIENEHDRRMTIMTTTFIPCSAKLPIIAMISGAFFGNAAWVSTSSYFLGIGSIIVSGIMLKKTKRFRGEASPFVMELPSYRIPTAGSVLRSTWERGWSFIKKASSVILLSAILIWFLQTYGLVEGALVEVEDSTLSFAANLGNLIAWMFAPLGFGNWQASIASVMGLVAKENLVTAYGIFLGIGEVAEDGAEFWPQLLQTYTAVGAYAFLAFNLLCAPCFAAIGAIKREMNNAGWTWFAIGYQMLWAWCVALIINQIGSLILYGTFGVWTVVAILMVIAIAFLLWRPDPQKHLRTAHSAA